MKISSNFDSGNIKVIEINGNTASLEIQTDANADFKQWFHFRCIAEAGVEQQFTILNANDCSYVEGWNDYHAVASYDTETWFRVNTSFDGERLTINHTPEQNSIFYAYFAPYSLDRHSKLLHSSQISPICNIMSVAKTVDGRDLDLLHICSVSDTTNLNTAWIIARQHPGEAMAEWCAEGVLARLLDEDDAIARALLKNWQFFVVPNMNLDGSTRGHLRANAAGANLNREWLNPSEQSSPEVYYVRAMMQKSGCDLFLDLHGDEAIPYTFVAGSEGIPSFNQQMNEKEHRFTQEFLKTSPDFQTKHGYPTPKPGEADLSMASNWVAENFNCLALTVEMPFKDHLLLQDNVFGWSPERSKLLGEALVAAIYAYSI